MVLSRVPVSKHSQLHILGLAHSPRPSRLSEAAELPPRRAGRAPVTMATRGRARPRLRMRRQRPLRLGRPLRQQRSRMRGGRRSAGSWARRNRRSPGHVVRAAGSLPARADGPAAGLRWHHSDMQRQRAAHRAV